MIDTSFVTQVHDHCGDIRCCRDELRFLANAFEITGNQPIADRLYLIAANLDDAQATLRRHHGEEINRGLKQAQEGNAELFKAILGGVFNATPAQDAP
jgi:hypothetical protein